jgi:hypothetical protein
VAQEWEEVRGEEFLEGGVVAEQGEVGAEVVGDLVGEEELTVDVVDGDLTLGFGELEEGVRAEIGVGCFDVGTGRLHQGKFGLGGSFAGEDESLGLGSDLKVPHAGQNVLLQL